MPRFPNFSSRVHRISGSVFERYRKKMIAKGENLIKLHIGDTYLPVKYPLRIPEAVLQREPASNRYCSTFGIDALRDALRTKLASDNGFQVERHHILMTCGATNALSISTMSLVEPGEEVLILTPAWPFFFGMVDIAGGVSHEVPFYTRLFADPDLDIRDLLEKHVNERTVALYVNTPNNPSGKVLRPQQLQAVAEIAARHNLWVVSDEAYDGLTFDGRQHHSIATFDNMFERTISIFTFSKSFMFAGLRLGYAVAAEAVIHQLNKMMVHQLYSPSTLAQQMMIEPVKTRHEWMPQVREHYENLRDLFVTNLAIDFPRPEGTYFIFFPTEPFWKQSDYGSLIETCLESGVSVAPGDSFGKDFHSYIRLCFTGEPAERLQTGIERLNAIFAPRGP